MTVFRLVRMLMVPLSDIYLFFLFLMNQNRLQFLTTPSYFLQTKWRFLPDARLLTQPIMMLNFNNSILYLLKLDKRLSCLWTYRHP